MKYFQYLKAFIFQRHINTKILLRLQRKIKEAEDDLKEAEERRHKLVDKLDQIHKISDGYYF